MIAPGGDSQILLAITDVTEEEQAALGQMMPPRSLRVTLVECAEGQGHGDSGDAKQMKHIEEETDDDESDHEEDDVAVEVEMSSTRAHLVRVVCNDKDIEMRTLARIMCTRCNMPLLTGAGLEPHGRVLPRARARAHRRHAAGAARLAQDEAAPPTSSSYWGANRSRLGACRSRWRRCATLTTARATCSTWCRATCSRCSRCTECWTW